MNTRSLILIAAAALLAPAQTAAPALGGTIAGKNGPSNARVWSFVIGNAGPGNAVNAQITSLSFVRTNGAPCSPIVRSPLPVNAGTIAPQSTAQVSMTIDFSACDAGALFKVTAAESANNGAARGSIVRLNQLQ